MSKELTEDLLDRKLRSIIREELPECIREAQKPEYLTNADMKQYLDCSERKLQYMRDNRQIDFIKLGGMIFYHRDEVNRYLEKNKIPSKHHVY